MSSGDRSDFGRIQGHIPARNDDATDPVKIGGHASIGLPEPVEDGQLVDTYHDEFGRIVTLIGGSPEIASDTVGPKTVLVTDTGTTEIVAAQGATQSVRVSSIYCSNNDPDASLTVTINGFGEPPRMQAHLRFDGGGVVWSFEPNGWVLAGNLALHAALTVASTYGVSVNTQFNVIATPAP